jgi:hypothetical protein
LQCRFLWHRESLWLLRKDPLAAREPARSTFDPTVMRNTQLCLRDERPPKHATGTFSTRSPLIDTSNRGCKGFHLAAITAQARQDHFIERLLWQSPENQSISWRTAACSRSSLCPGIRVGAAPGGSGLGHALFAGSCRWCVPFSTAGRPIHLQQLAHPGPEASAA